MNIKSFLQRHPVFSYFFLAYAISWGGCLALVGPKFFRGDALSSVDFLLLLLPMLAGPSIAGVVMTAIMDGKPGLQNLRTRMGKWRVGLRWVALALLLPPVLVTAILFSLSYLVSPVFSPRFVPVGIVFGVLVGFFEEIGWMGFAFPKMRMKQSALTAGIVLGLLWTIWHAVADYLGGSGTWGEYWLPHFLVWMVATFTAMRVLIAWVYTNTGSVLLAQLMHASSTGFLYVFGPALSAKEDMLFYGIYAAVLWILAIVVAAKYGKNLSLSMNSGNI